MAAVLLIMWQATEKHNFNWRSVSAQRRSPAVSKWLIKMKSPSRKASAGGISMEICFIVRLVAISSGAQFQQRHGTGNLQWSSQISRLDVCVRGDNPNTSLIAAVWCSGVMESWYQPAEVAQDQYDATCHITTVWRKLVTQVFFHSTYNAGTYVLWGYVREITVCITPETRLAIQT